MNKHREISDYIDGIYTAINDVLDFTLGMTVEAFCSDINPAIKNSSYAA